MNDENLRDYNNCNFFFVLTQVLALMELTITAAFVMLVLRGDTAMFLLQAVATKLVSPVCLVRKIITLSPVVLVILVSRGTGKTVKVG